MSDDTPADRRTGPMYAEARGIAGQAADALGRDNIFFVAVEMTRMPMIVTDPRQPDNPVVFANRAFLGMTGYRAEEIVGRNCRFLQGSGTDRETIRELRKAIADRREFATEILNYRKDGYSFWNALFVSPVFDEAGDLIYFFGSQLDVSRRREAEENLRQAYKMEALGRLTGGIAHDFNNLLQVIGGYLDLIGVSLARPEIDRVKLSRSVANARIAADRAAALTHQLLAFARKQRLEGRIINLNDLIESMRELSARTLGEDVRIETVLSPLLVTCRVDPGQIETALLNILINARDALAGRPEKRLTITTQNVRVDREEVTSYPGLSPGLYAAVAIADTGSGIPAHAIERVMDPFFTTKEEGRGTGLGLSMVYGFAKQSGGAAHISSTEGMGTTIRIYLPAADSTAAAQRPTDRGSALERPGSETILVVEDRADIAELARTILIDLGYTVLLAGNAKAALQVIDEAAEIHLLFTDLIMPGEMNGVELAREAKRRRNRLRVLLTTGYVEASDERADVGGLEFDILNKPYGRTELARKVRVVIDGPTGVT